MSRSTDLVSRILDIVGTKADAGVYVRTGTSALTRFANSFIHQNVSDDVVHVHLTVALDGRVASGSTTSTTDDALNSLVDRLVTVAAMQPVDSEFPGFGGSVEAQEIDHFDEETSRADPNARAEIVKTFVGAGDGLLAAGMCGVDSYTDAYGNTAERFIDGRMTRVVLDGIHQTETSAGSGHSAGQSLGSIDATGAGRLASHRAILGINAFDTKPGEYEVVLAPEAMATIAQFLTGYGFSGKSYNEGMSFVTLNEQRFDPTVHLKDDVSDPRGLGIPFDAEGTPRKTIAVIDGGATPSLLHDRRTATKAGNVSTGHASVTGEAWDNRPSGRNLFFGEGTWSEEDLIAHVERGIYVSTFNYCRVLDPKTVVVTGLTRNGTFMIENGAITGAVTNLRFTQSFIDALGPGRVKGIGANGRFAAGEDESGTVHTPTFHLASWNFTGGAAG
ncbi:MAG: metallopeptidase TldD-related protein [Acidimicrobiia bacterium]|nr:metallopeptidase TldD-related protein [Acidimicrobiia bacterium]